MQVVLHMESVKQQDKQVDLLLSLLYNVKDSCR